MFVDSHCHLNYLDDPPSALNTARDAGVTRFLCIGVNQQEIQAVLAYATNNADVWASVGEHPGSVSDDRTWIEPLAGHDRVVALGEMGLDYFYVEDEALQARQRIAFEEQMSLASRLHMPVIIHTRDAVDDTLAIMRAFPNVRGVMHCFTESWSMAEQALELGYYISISGIVTFNNADNVREVARQVPLQKLLIETDAPWLAPVPHRGQQNQPAFVTSTAEFLAVLRGEPLAELAAATSANFAELFAL